MKHKEGISREQMMLLSFEEMIPEKSIVRVIDRFIESCDLEQLGFKRTIPALTGRPPYQTSAMMKLYVYGYENGVRSSRRLEQETKRNVEAMWLMNGLTPDHKTIAEFRRQNIRPLQKLFGEFVKLCKHWDMISGKIIAVDGTKIRASNNKKLIYNKKKLEERIDRIDKKIKDYFVQIEEADKAEARETAQAIPKTVEELTKRKEQYEKYLKHLEDTGDKEISVVDPDARLMGSNHGSIESAYNIQSAVDSKAKLIVEYDVTTSATDHGQLGNMVGKVQKRLKIKRFTVIADKGYYQGKDLRKVKKQKVEAIVAKQNVSVTKGHSPEYSYDKFTYDEKTDSYKCPAGRILEAHSQRSTVNRKFYSKEACRGCPHLGKCVPGEEDHRLILRGQYAKYYEETDRRTCANRDIYRLRQQLVEHPFGTIKRSMNGYHFLLRTRRKVRSEVALLFLGYNLKRAYKELGFDEIMARLDAVISDISLNLRRFFNISKVFAQ